MFTWFGRRGEVLFLVGRLGAGQFHQETQGLKDPRLLRYCSEWSVVKDLLVGKVAHSPPLPVSTEEVLGALLTVT